MARFIGSPASYGFFEKQVLLLTGLTSEYQLLYKVGSPTAMLVIKNDMIQEAAFDYTLTDGGTNVLFSDLPLITDRIYIIFLGRELSIPRTAGLQPYRAEAVGNGISTTFTLPFGPLVEEALQVFADGVLQRFTEDWTLAINGFDVIFNVAPANGVDLDFYIHGLERSDTITVDDHSITGQKLQIGINIGTSLDPAGNIFANDLVLEGNLTVNGTTTTFNTATLSIADNEIILNSDFTSGTPTENAYIVIKRGDEDDAQFVWDETTDAFYAGISSNLELLIRQSDFESHTLNFSNPHAVTKSQVGLSNVTNDSQLKRSANDFNTFTLITSVADSDILLLEDASDSGNKKSVAATNILPPTLTGDHDFTGNITFSGTVSISADEITFSSVDFETTDGLSNTALTIPLTDDTAYMFEGKIIARDTNNLSNKTYWAKAEGAVRRNNAGSATLVGTSLIHEDEESGSGYQAAVAVSGNNLLVNVTGAVGETVHWTVLVKTIKTN